MKKRIWAVAVLLAFLIPVVAVSAANATHADHDDHLNKGMGTIRYEGVKNSTFARGNFVIHGDTSQMNDVHGEGHFRGTLTGGVEGGGNSTVMYKMHWTVSTHTEHTEARDDDKETDPD